MVRRSKERVEVRLSPASIHEIDALIERGLFTSRSDYLSQLVTSDLAERKTGKNIRDLILDIIRIDPEIIEEIRKI
jgi:Arc/MetJ-type ribon-helix-helix transcriptional regulator